jgi:hypothetical protein
MTFSIQSGLGAARPDRRNKERLGPTREWLTGGSGQQWKTQRAY